MKVALGSDHAGFELKEHLKTQLHRLGHEVLDLGTHFTVSVDYPDYAEAVGLAICDRKAQRGILECGNRVIPSPDDRARLLAGNRH